MTLLEAALALHDADLCVVPASTDGEKRPVSAWKDYQTVRPRRDQVQAWFTGGHYDGLGVITGAVSGNAEMFELEGRAHSEGVTVALTELADQLGLGEVWKRVSTGYLEFTPRGGIHVIYYVAGAVAGNTKLARRPSTAEELADWKNTEPAAARKTITDPARLARRLEKIAAATPEQVPQTLIETRGEGGFTICAPSAGRTHPNGRAWHLAQGSPHAIATITEEERDALHQLARAFDQMPAPATDLALPRQRGEQPADGRQRPGDDYNARASWDDILIPDGWTVAYRRGGVTYWRRPGKTIGVSATTGRNDADNLYIFSSSTEFDIGTPYSKFGAHCLLEHGGDWAAAARALAAAGYGDPLPEPAIKAFTPVIIDSGGGPPGPPAEDCTLTDDGNGRMLIDRFGDRIRYIADQRQWLNWDGSRWRRDHDGAAVSEYVKALARAMPADSKDLRRHRGYSLSARGCACALQMARTDPRIRVDAAALDADPWIINTPAGVVDLRTGQLAAPDPKMLVTRCTSAAPDPAADAPRWRTFLADTFAGDPAMTLYVQQLLGLSIIGRVLEPVLPFCHGSGANGKTTLATIAATLLGLGEDGYAMPIGPELLIAGLNDHPASLAQLQGARLVIASEINDGQRFDEATIKQLTGGDPIRARFMRQNYFTFIPSHTLWLLANDKPAVRSGGPAFWRRLRLLPFLHSVDENRQIKDLHIRLINDEGPAILAWMIEGAAKYLATGLTQPESVTKATSGYRRESDTVARFIGDCCQTGDVNAPHMAIRVQALRAAYEAWCRGEGEEPVTAKAFTGRLRAGYGVASGRDRHNRFYLGIRLSRAGDTFANVSPEPVTDEQGSFGDWTERR